MIKLQPYMPRKQPSKVSLFGHYITLESIDWAKHGPSLSQNITGADNTALWDYIPIGPFDNQAGLQNVFSYVATQKNWETLAILSNTSGNTLGTTSYMRLRPEHGSAEVGCVVFGKSLQKTRGATEALYLMAKHTFEDLEYRRFEWKCDNGNADSKRAALRLGFQFEGVFRNDMVMKGRNRDTAWFSMIDTDWPVIKAGFETWLSEENFSEDGMQLSTLKDCRECR
jgi:RimJ/RimL family protein N-acetyltransferase